MQVELTLGHRRPAHASKTLKLLFAGCKGGARSAHRGPDSDGGAAAATRRRLPHPPLGEPRIVLYNSATLYNVLILTPGCANG